MAKRQVPKGQGEGLGQAERKKAQAWVDKVKNSGKDQVRPSQERKLSHEQETYKGGKCSRREEEASRASASSGWEGKGKLQGKGLSQGKTIQSKGTERGG